MSFRPIEEPTQSVSGKASPTSSKPTTRSQPQPNPSGDSADDQQQTSTTGRSALLAEMIQRKTSKPSAESTTDGDTEFTGTEPLDFVLTLPKASRRKWVLMRLAAYQRAVQDFAEEFSNARMTHKSVADSEQAAIRETEGMTRSIPHEAPILAQIFVENK